TSQNKVAARLSLSGATVSQVLHNNYRARLDAVEERVRGVFMNALVACPALGTMPTQVCQDWRSKAAVFRTGNPLRNRMYRECHRCPRYRPAPEVADDPA
ncbi:MAG: hypothetical protein Q8K20_13965, partial [Gemmobacter sp.]|nr:hypothetical protein [Gemmobacter sp.]